VLTRNFFFFFQAEDGIRDDLVTGVQTCALPILAARARRSPARQHGQHGARRLQREKRPIPALTPAGVSTSSKYSSVSWLPSNVALDRLPGESPSGTKLKTSPSQWLSSMRGEPRLTCS